MPVYLITIFYRDGSGFDFEVSSATKARAIIAREKRFGAVSWHIETIFTERPE